MPSTMPKVLPLPGHRGIADVARQSGFKRLTLNNWVNSVHAKIARAKERGERPTLTPWEDMVRNAKRHSKHTKFWVFPNADADRIERKGAELRSHTESLSQLAKKLRINPRTAKERDFGQVDAFGTFRITADTRDEALELFRAGGRDAVFRRFPRLRRPRFVKTRLPRGAGDVEVDIATVPLLDSRGVRSIPGAPDPSVLRERASAYRAAHAGKDPPWMVRPMRGGTIRYRKPFVLSLARQRRLSLIKVGEAAKLIGVTPATIGGWADRGHIESEKTASGTRLIIREPFLAAAAHYLRIRSDSRSYGLPPSNRLKLGHWKYARDIAQTGLKSGKSSQPVRPEIVAAEGTLSNAARLLGHLDFDSPERATLSQEYSKLRIRLGQAWLGSVDLDQLQSDADRLLGKLNEHQAPAI